MEVQEHVSLAPYTTFGIGGAARYFVRAGSETDVEETIGWAKERSLPLFILGGGSNLLVADEGFAGVVLRVDIRGVQQQGCQFDVGAGEPWDALVDRTITAGCGGMECLAGIPGSTGATPVQNVGAYGQEVGQTVTSVRAFDRSTEKFVDLTAESCRFRYRMSLFNTEEPGRYLITRVRFALRSGSPPELRYPELAQAFSGRPEPPSLAEVAEAVRRIRRGKGMVVEAGDPDTQSAGSYFRNPVVPRSDIAKIAAAVGMESQGLPVYPGPGPECVKLSAAWLIERAGFGKGFRLGPAGLSSRHTLALTNRGGARCADILALEKTIRDGVLERFGIGLEREPVLLGVST